MIVKIKTKSGRKIIEECVRRIDCEPRADNFRVYDDSRSRYRDYLLSDIEEYQIISERED